MSLPGKPPKIRGFKLYCLHYQINLPQLAMKRKRGIIYVPTSNVIVCSVVCNKSKDKSTQIWNVTGVVNLVVNHAANFSINSMAIIIAWFASQSIQMWREIWGMKIENGKDISLILVDDRPALSKSKREVVEKSRNMRMVDQQASNNDK